MSGCTILDVGGPAVSNYWIINKAFLGLQQNPDIKTAIIQLTSLDKLDVEVDQDRINQLVMPDPLRNFVIDHDFEVRSKDQMADSGVWPSSVSDHHESKKQWRRWLYSPGLETEELYCKLILLNHYCQHHQITLYVYQGYNIPWTQSQNVGLKNIIQNINSCWHTEYIKSSHYQQHDHQDLNTVPCLSYQLELSYTVAQHLPELVKNKLIKFKSAYEQNRQPK
jgi:hypothetical protein